MRNSEGERTMTLACSVHRTSRTALRNIWLLAATLIGCSQSVFCIYGPSLKRADPSISLLACQEAKFNHGRQITEAMQSGHPDAIVAALDVALKEFRGTSATSTLYPARAFCLHELVPNSLPPNTQVATHGLPTHEVREFEGLGLKYFYYEPDGRWTLRKDPIDLVELATKHLDSRWGRQAFLMMTQLGWSYGACREGSDQFREVIRRGEKFLASYPVSEVSDEIRLEIANAYATWWNLSLSKDSSSNKYKKGAGKAKEAAVHFYRAYLNSRKTPDQEVETRLEELRGNPKGSNTFDYFCADYED